MNETADTRDDGRSASRAKRSLSVLVADDTPANQNVVRRLLSGRGHRIVVAGNGCEALTQFEQGRFDIVLMDVEMPVMDGYAATRAIREFERTRKLHTPIIALTTHSATDAREACLAAGMDVCLSKPLDAGKLFELVERLPRRASDKSAEARDVARTIGADDPQPVIDVKGTLRRLGGDLELFRDFIALFDEDAPRLMRTLRAAAAASDGEQVARAAHSLRGLTVNFGASGAVEAAAKMEECGLADDAAGMPPLLARLEEEIARLMQALEEHRRW